MKHLLAKLRARQHERKARALRRQMRDLRHLAADHERRARGLRLYAASKRAASPAVLETWVATSGKLRRLPSTEPARRWSLSDFTLTRKV